MCEEFAMFLSDGPEPVIRRLDATTDGVANAGFNRVCHDGLDGGFEPRWIPARCDVGYNAFQSSVVSFPVEYVPAHGRVGPFCVLK